MDTKANDAGQATETALKATAKAKDASQRAFGYGMFGMGKPDNRAPSQKIKDNEDAMAAHTAASDAHETAKDAHAAVGHTLQAKKHEDDSDNHKISAIEHKRRAAEIPPKTV